MALLDNLKWRSAIKNFDSTQKISADKLDELLAAVQLSPSSAGLQPYRVVVVSDPEVRVKLRAAAYGQAQLTDASEIIIFAAETNINEDLVKEFIDLVADTRGVERESLAGYEGMINGSVASKTAEERVSWAQKQAYIAAGVLTAAAAELKIDTCTMEGFNPVAFNEILGLDEKGLTASVITAVGYRSDADVYSKMAKVRKPADKLFIKI